VRRHKKPSFSKATVFPGFSSLKKNIYLPSKKCRFEANWENKSWTLPAVGILLPGNSFWNDGNTPVKLPWNLAI